MERYYLKIRGKQGSVVAHENLASAYAEAHRLMEAVKDAELVYVLQVIGTVSRNEVARRKKVG